MCRKWTESEIDYLKENYTTLKYSEIGDALNRSQKSIEKKIINLNLRKNNKLGRKSKRKTNNSNIKKKNRWNKEEEIYLSNNYGTLSINELTNKLNRTPNSIFKKANRLGLIKTTYSKNGEKISKKNKTEEWKVNFIIDNFFVLKKEEISKVVNLTEEQVYHIARYRGIKSTDKEYREYCEEEINVIKDNWANRDIKKILSLLNGRTERAIISKASQLGLLCDKTLTNTSKDGIVLNSGEEKMLYEFIRFDMGINIVPIGLKKEMKMYNDVYEESYYPDFIIYDISNRPIIIEYYGMITIEKYKEKSFRKNEYYKSLNEYEFIDLYPKDLKNNFKGVKNKLAPFIMQKNNKLIV